jgi:iron complex outermembrane receptor protein
VEKPRRLVIVSSISALTALPLTATPALAQQPQLEIEQTRMFNMRDIEQRTPNLAFSVASDGSSGSLQGFIRGVGQFDFAITVDPGVGLYVDGVYLARTVGANFEFSDIERISVLRGPQGTLFGKNTIGGALNVVTRRPSGETHFSAEVTGGEDNYFSFECVRADQGFRWLAEAGPGRRRR